MNKSTYHHGDLSNALVAAALGVVEREGAEALSLRELAAALGVSRAAPYRHFDDREALLAAVAALGFEELIAGYEEAMARPGTGRERLRRVTRVYFDFAVKRPGLHRLMFEGGLLARDAPPEMLRAPAGKCYRLLWQAVQGAYPGLDDKAVKARTITMWSTVFGFLALRAGHTLQPFMAEPLTEAELIEVVFDAAIGPGDG